jgi:hypothetical protein
MMPRTACSPVYARLFPRPIVLGITRFLICIPELCAAFKLQSIARNSVQTLMHFDAAVILALYEVQRSVRVFGGVMKVTLYPLVSRPFKKYSVERHVAGMANMIQIRGHKSFSTEFEKSLLLAQLGPIVSKSAVRWYIYPCPSLILT